MQRNNGGAEFPGEHSIRFGQTNDCNEGMTLRDYFAAKALVAYFSDGAGFALQHEASKWAYETADAMLEARG